MCLLLCLLLHWTHVTVLVCNNESVYAFSFAGHLVWGVNNRGGEMLLSMEGAGGVGGSLFSMRASEGIALEGEKNGGTSKGGLSSMRASDRRIRNAASGGDSSSSVRSNQNGCGVSNAVSDNGYRLPNESSNDQKTERESNGTERESIGYGLPDNSTRVVMLSSLTHHAGSLNWHDMQVRVS